MISAVGSDTAYTYNCVSGLSLENLSLKMEVRNSVWNKKAWAEDKRCPGPASFLSLFIERHNPLLILVKTVIFI